MKDAGIYRLMKLVHEVYWNSNLPLSVKGGVSVAYEVVRQINKIHGLPGVFKMNDNNGHWWFYHKDGRVLKPYGIDWYRANTDEEVNTSQLAYPNGN